MICVMVVNVSPLLYLQSSAVSPTATRKMWMKVLTTYSKMLRTVKASGSRIEYMQAEVAVADADAELKCLARALQSPHVLSQGGIDSTC